jgi:hypothetical protein
MKSDDPAPSPKRPDPRYRLIAAGLAVAIVLAAVILAIASGDGHHVHPGGATTSAKGASAGRTEVAVAAGYLGVSVASLRAQLRAGRSLAQIAHATPGRSQAALVARLLAARLAALHAAQGKLGASEEAARAAALRAAVAARVRRKGFGVGGVVPAADLPVAARYLGMIPVRLAEQLQPGRSLAQVADSTRGRSSAGLIEALTANRLARLKAAVANGLLSAEQERRLAANLPRRIATEVRRK